MSHCAQAERAHWLASETRVRGQLAGYAATSGWTDQRTRVTLGALRDALPGFRRLGSRLCEMHRGEPVGSVTHASVDERGLFVTVTVTDPSAWAKVQAGTYRGFSLGFKYARAADGVIRGIDLLEISLAPYGACPGTDFRCLNIYRHN